MEDILRDPVELLDENLYLVAGGLSIDVDVNVAVINQLIVQIQVLGSNNAATGANVAGVTLGS